MAILPKNKNKQTTKKMAVKTHENETEYYSVFDGKIVKILKEPNEKSKVLTRTNGSIFNAECYDVIVSTVTGLTITKKDFTKDNISTEIISLNVKLFDGTTRECLSVLLDSNPASGIILRMLNPDFNFKAESLIGAMKDGNGYSLCYIKQNGVTIKSPYSKENPTPEWKKVIVSGKELWDKTDFLNFLTEKVEFLNEKLGYSKEQKTINPITNIDESELKKENVYNTDGSVCEDDDLPF